MLVPFDDGMRQPVLRPWLTDVERLIPNTVRLECASSIVLLCTSLHRFISQ